MGVCLCRVFLWLSCAYANWSSFYYFLYCPSFLRLSCAYANSDYYFVGRGRPSVYCSCRSCFVDGHPHAVSASASWLLATFIIYKSLTLYTIITLYIHVQAYRVQSCVSLLVINSCFYYIHISTQRIAFALKQAKYLLLQERKEARHWFKCNV